MSSAPKVLFCRYHYDPLDRLISQSPLDLPVHQRFYCKSRLATEIHGALGFSIIRHDDQLLAEQQREADAVETLLLGTDLQRSVSTRLKAQHTPAPIAYSPYGHHPALSAVPGLLAFNGERPDPVTGHYLLGNGYRAFNPLLMRFNSPDNLSPFGKGGLNPYAYCLGDPINLSDPQGHAPVAKVITTIIKKQKLLTTINRGNKLLNKPQLLSHPTAKYKVTLNSRATDTTKIKNLINKSARIEHYGIETGQLAPSTITDAKTTPFERYISHQQAGVPFDDAGIPSSSYPISDINARGEELLTTRVHDDAIDFFDQQSKAKAPEEYRRAMVYSTRGAIIRRSEFLIQHVRRS